MSRITYLYPELTERDYTHNPTWQVREDDDEYETYSIDDPVPKHRWNSLQKSVPNSIAPSHLPNC